MSGNNPDLIQKFKEMIKAKEHINDLKELSTNPSVVFH